MTGARDSVTVTQADIEAGTAADDGAIAVARALSSRDCGALQSEMREARKVYLAEAFARHREAAQAELVEALTPFAEIAHGEVWERFIADSRMTLRISNGDGSRHLCFINAECFIAARSTLSKINGGEA